MEKFNGTTLESLASLMANFVHGEEVLAILKKTQGPQLVQAAIYDLLTSHRCGAAVLTRPGCCTSNQRQGAALCCAECREGRAFGCCRLGMAWLCLETTACFTTTHRDRNIKNIMLTDQGKLKLIDNEVCTRLLPRALRWGCGQGPCMAQIERGAGAHDPDGDPMPSTSSGRGEYLRPTQLFGCCRMCWPGRPHTSMASAPSSCQLPGTM